MKELRIGQRTAEFPIIQGGMGVGISLAGLAAAVARAGAIGVIAAAGIGAFRPKAATNLHDADIIALRQEIRQARSQTQGAIGVNVMVAMTDYAELVRTSIEEGADFVFSGAGLPLDLPSYRTQDSKTMLVPIVSSARAFRLIAQRWISRYDYPPDAVVVEGPLAGGHLGFKREQIQDPHFRLEELIPAVVNEARRLEAAHGKPIPVIAGGGIYTGQDIYDITQFGADGVQMATRFVGTYECDAAPEFKQAYLDAGQEDIVVIQSPVGMPGRAIRNRFIDDVAQGRKKPFKCPYHCIVSCDVVNSPYCIAIALTNAKRGDLRNGFAFAGANAWRVNEIVSVADLLSTLEAEYDAAASHDRASQAEPNPRRTRFERVR